MWTSTRTTATELDSTDELAGLRARYDLPPGVIRLDGNSGGPLPRTTPARLRKFVEHRWDAYSARPRMDSDWRCEARVTASVLARLIGAHPDELTVAESTSMNLFKALLGGTRLRPDRKVLAVGDDCFATDRYIARSAADFIGGELRLVQGIEELPNVLHDNVAVVALSHTDLTSGAVRDPAAITAEVHRHGALALWDLSHSAGALSVDLHRWNTDFAIGCGHKYLGGGSGAPAYYFVAERHHDALAATFPTVADRSATGVINPLATAFEGAPSTLSASELRTGLSILDGVSADALEAKTTALVAMFLERLHEHGIQDEVEIVMPADESPRGSQVSLRHRHAQYLAHGLFARGVVVDFVEPDVLRFSFAPSWLRYVDVWEAAELLHEVLEDIDHRWRA